MFRMARASGTYSQPVVPPPPPDPLEPWTDDLAASGTTPVGVLILGTSVTSGQGVADINDSYVVVLQDLFDTSHGVGNAVVNATGHPGATSSRYTVTETFELGTPTPSVVLIELGVNDMPFTIAPNQTKANLLNTIDLIRSETGEDTPIVLVILYDIWQEFDIPWDDYAVKIASIGDQVDYVSVLDLRPDFGAPSVTFLNPDPDPHPNIAGHDLIASLTHTFLTA